MTQGHPGGRTPDRAMPVGGGGWETVEIAGADGPVPARVHMPRRTPVGWLVWAHGGSWHGGSAKGWHHATAEFAQLAECVVVSVDYRLAPHHSHPAPVDDVLAALAWVRGRAEQDGTPAPIAVGGDSAGGTIAAAAALAARDGGERLDAQVLAYPPLDPECRAESYRGSDAFPGAEWLRASWRGYRGSSPTVVRRDRTLHSTPLDTDHLTGVATAILAVGADDPVLGDVTGYARLLRTWGAAVDLHVLPATGHGVFLAPSGSVARLRSRLAAALHALFAGSAEGAHR
ncbi:alpha/beta hydrolase fold domain-containing protein [Streptomonospora salina]|uniref:Acetyl esterase n=1 Tax=Streptomonospora salina TaxID=104205 RepID=A0A841E3Z9_9ACTN|nr:alpha/beta hydrolase fold domain-containing protein [Streptomonospora salina]MBB5998577.1 acetyl esterase [Streptomonospora salina]